MLARTCSAKTIWYGSMHRIICNTFGNVKTIGGSGQLSPVLIVHQMSMLEQHHLLQCSSFIVFVLGNHISCEDATQAFLSILEPQVHQHVKAQPFPHIQKHAVPSERPSEESWEILIPLLDCFAERQPEPERVSQQVQDLKGSPLLPW